MSNLHTTSCFIVWFRLDLRLQDNLALDAAIKEGLPIIPIYIHNDSPKKAWSIGATSKWWLHFALKDLDSELNKLGSKLIIFKEQPPLVLKTLCSRFNVSKIFWNECYEPNQIKLDNEVKKLLNTLNIKIGVFESNLLYHPSQIKNSQGSSYKIFSAYWKACTTHFTPRKVITVNVKSIKVHRQSINSTTIENLKLLPKFNWDKQFYDIWIPTAKEAHKRLNHFAKELSINYYKNRNFPALDGTSKLSPYLHFGQISSHQILEVLQKNNNSKSFHAELGWREFAYYQLFYNPQIPDQPLRPEFNSFPWIKNKKYIQAWQQGLTGYPFIDAAMRQLWNTGWMHNRLRMVVGSFLVKHLLIPWQVGEQWFWDTLLDADLANNSLGWQWVAGCGIDAAPFFRVFNPILQGKKFDPHGKYIAQYLPEISHLPSKYIHCPWIAPKDILKQAGISLGKNYPTPIVDISQGRTRALALYEKLKYFSKKH